MAKNKNVDAQIEQILREAEAKGLRDNLMFETLLNTFTDQKETLRRLKEQIDAEEVLVAKEHTKGLVNTVVNPCIPAYNSTANAMCNTVGAMTKILRNLGSDSNKDGDPLSDMLKG
jgi:hypothetical protein